MILSQCSHHTAATRTVNAAGVASVTVGAKQLLGTTTESQISCHAQRESERTSTRSKVLAVFPHAVHAETPAK